MIEFIKQHYELFFIAVIGIYLALKEILSGSSGLKNSIINDQKIRISQIGEERDRCDDKAREYELKNEAHKATLVEKDKFIEDLKEQVAFRNPDLTNLIKQGFDINKKVIEFMEKNIKMMVKINEKMDYQTNILERGAKRNKKIDEATAKHQGNPLRKT